MFKKYLDIFKVEESYFSKSFGSDEAVCNHMNNLFTCWDMYSSCVVSYYLRGEIAEIIIDGDVFMNKSGF